MLNHLDGVFLIALRLMLRLQPEAAAMEITFALIGGIICARQVRSEKVRQAMLRWPPLAAIGAEILEMLLVPLEHGGNWGLVAGHCAVVVVFFWLGFLATTLIIRRKEKCPQQNG